MKTIEVLISAMHQEDISLAKKCNADADVLIINQCDKNEYYEEMYNGHRIRMISTTERGTSNSRNMAIKNAIGDICILSDDDECFIDGYKEVVLDAYSKQEDADVIAFDVNVTNTRGMTKVVRKDDRVLSKVPFYRTYGTWSLTFKRENILNMNAVFNTDFGPGTNKISSGEESVWQHLLKKNGAKFYHCNFTMVRVEQGESTWFTGYNESYFYDRGAFLAVSMPKVKNIFKYYYLYRLKDVAEISILNQIKWLNNGIKGYGKYKLSYDEFKQKKVKK